MKQSQYYIMVSGISCILGNQQQSGTYMKALLALLVVYFCVMAIGSLFKEMKK